MSRIHVLSDDGRVTVYITDMSGDDDPESWTIAKCSFCGDVMTDRGHFEDTIRVAEDHADQCR